MTGLSSVASCTATFKSFTVYPCRLHGMELLRCRYWNDPEVLKKLGSAMGDSMEGFPGMGAGQMPPGFPGAVENGTAAAAAKEADGNGDADGEAEEPTVHSAASTGVLQPSCPGHVVAAHPRTGTSRVQYCKPLQQCGAHRGCWRTGKLTNTLV